MSRRLGRSSCQTKRQVAAVLLAAGRSTRFGDRPKQLLDWYGEPLVHHMARRLLACQADRVAVVVGHRRNEVVAAIADLDVQVIDNPCFAEGQSTSLRAGLDALVRSADAILFVPCDQPRLSVATLDRVIAASHAHVASLIDVRYPQHAGPPTLFPCDFVPQLRELRGDTGGRSILRRHPDRLRSVPVTDPLEGMDIDTPEDLERLLGATR